jgi:hypothetical protein
LRCRSRVRSSMLQSVSLEVRFADWPVLELIERSLRLGKNALLPIMQLLFEKFELPFVHERLAIVWNVRGVQIIMEIADFVGLFLRLGARAHKILHLSQSPQ